MTPAEFEVRLMQCLDERRDPFLDAELAPHLADDAEVAVRVADLLARLVVVTQNAAPRREAASLPAARHGCWRSRALRCVSLPLLAAALLVAVVLAVWGSRPTEHEAPGRVLRASLSTDFERPLAATITVRTVLARERGLQFQTFDKRVVRR
ncbi:MAG: hypothetical protein JNN13_01845 [Planctomycetes bacterium]|nr:hypothetical protein [Planctomycetota bacterium]